MRIDEAPRHRDGYYQARPGDVIGRDDLLVVDVRSSAELLDDFGHIHRVNRCDAHRIRQDGLPGVAHDRAVVLVCQNGRLSQACATSLAREHAYTEVYHLVGGMVRWVAEERPVAKTPTWRDL